MTIRRLILVGTLAGMASVAFPVSANAVSLYDVKGGGGRVHDAGQSVSVPIRFRCPTDENKSNGGFGVVIDLSLTQVDRQGRTIEGEAESVPVICNDKWKTIKIVVSRDSSQSTGPAFFEGKASEKGVMDSNGVDVATTPTGKDGSFTVHLDD